MRTPLAGLVLSLVITPVFAGTLTGQVVAISDGDTVTLLDSSYRQRKVRLVGIDAPEKSQPFGTRSRQNLADLVFGKLVVANCTKTDRYHRELCKIEVDGIDANLAQIEGGMAWHYKMYQKDQAPADRKLYAQAERDARQARRGLWIDRIPQAPWEYRKAKRRAR